MKSCSDTDISVYFKNMWEDKLLSDEYFDISHTISEKPHCDYNASTV